MSTIAARRIARGSAARILQHRGKASREQPHRLRPALPPPPCTMMAHEQAPREVPSASSEAEKWFATLGGCARPSTGNGPPLREAGRQVKVLRAQ